VLVKRYFEVDYIEEARSCILSGITQKCDQILIIDLQCEEKETLGKPRHMCRDNIKTDIK
jgi:hypothetical protein